MSPEEIEEEEEDDEKCDMYSMAITMYEILTRDIPWKALVSLSMALLRLSVTMFTRCTRGVADLLYLLNGTGFISDALLMHHSGMSPEIDVSASTFAPTVVLLFTPVPTPARSWLLLPCRAS